jgi:hypothetical protein
LPSALLSFLILFFPCFILVPSNRKFLLNQITKGVLRVSREYRGFGRSRARILLKLLYLGL